ncbi:MAG: PAS domain S-box protein [Pirellulales bacterium]|nr:PAS domain S-box protein [Pirellulales bacterium]
MNTIQRESSEAVSESILAGERHYRQLFDESIEAIALADRETGTILDCNPAFLRLTGYERSELIGRPQTMLHPPEEGNPPVTHNFVIHRSQEPGRVLKDRLITKSGAVKEVEIAAGTIELGGRRLLHGFFRDVTEELRIRRERETSLALLRLLNDRNHTHELIRNLTDFLRKWSGCEAVGVRLRDGDDFPYFETRGFSAEFVRAENYLCRRDLDGQISRDDFGNPQLDCMCGNVLCGRFDPALPFFTPYGSFWTNCTTELLANTTEAQRQARTRDRCNGEGYESVALIPLRHGERILGLLQFNDRVRGRFTPELISFLENISRQIAVALAQRQTQAALEDSEERYRRLFEIESDSIILIDVETFDILDVNEAALKLYGHTREEFLRLKATEVSAEPEKTRRFISSGQTHIPLRWHKKKDGTVFPVEIAGGYFDHQGRKIHVAALRDITQRMRDEEALRDCEERFRQMFDHIGSGMVVYEAVEDGADFLIKEFNPAAERIARMKRAEVLERPVSQVFPAVMDIGLFAMFQRVWRTGTPERLSESSYRDDRLSIWVENYVYKLPSGEIVAIFDDITERKRAEEQLRESEIWHRALIELGVSVYVVLDERRLIRYASPPARKVLGWRAEEIQGKTIFEFVASADAELGARFFAELYRSPGRRKRVLLHLRCKSGESKAMEIFGVNLLEEPAVKGIVLSGHDVSEQVRARERIDVLRAELTHASRLAAVGAIAAGIAHEINQPLAIVSTWAEIASREIRDNLGGDKREALLALMRIDAAMQRSGDILQHIKDFARKSGPAIAEVSMSDAIVEVLQLVDRQLRVAGVALSVEVDPELPPVLADRIQIQQVLLNLILNAVEALAGAEPQARRVEIRARVSGDALETAVSDAGCSVPAERLERIFDPFDSTKPEGLGLGLSICRTIILSHDGRIWAARNGERGTTVAFTLPLAKETFHGTKNDDPYRG